MLCVLFYNVLHFLLGKARIFSYCRNLNLRRLRADMGIKLIDLIVAPMLAMIGM